MIYSADDAYEVLKCYIHESNEKDEKAKKDGMAPIVARTLDYIDSTSSNSISPSPGKGWYAGITNDWERRREEHESDDEEETILHSKVVECNTTEDARCVEKRLVDKLGCQGGSGGGNDHTKFVYVFKTE